MTFAALINVGVASILVGIIVLYFRRARRLQSEESARPLLVDEKSAPPSTSVPSTSLGESLPQSIVEPDVDSIDRANWVIRLTHHVYDARHGRRYNVLTINTDIDYHFAPTGVVERLSVKYNESRRGRVIPYEVVVFRRGHLVRLGDGGYINWCFEGNFERAEDCVTFNDIT